MRENKDTKNKLEKRVVKEVPTHVALQILLSSSEQQTPPVQLSKIAVNNTKYKQLGI
jgi:hypothetical protein